MPKLDAAAVAKLLAEYGCRSALRGGNPYRARAYRQAAENLVTLTEPLAQVIAEGRLREIPGVGTAIADIITTLHETGTHPNLEKMRKEVPEGVLHMLSIPELRPEKALKVYQELGIASLEQLEQAAKQDRLRGVKGLGGALQAKILQGIDIRRRAEGQRHIHRAADLLKLAEANLKRSKLGARRIQPAGDFRRGCELIGDLSLVAEVPRTKTNTDSLFTDAEIKVHVSDAAHCGANATAGDWVRGASGSIACLRQKQGLLA
jgi:DNA polymerase (family 10)